MSNQRIVEPERALTAEHLRSRTEGEGNVHSVPGPSDARRSLKRARSESPGLDEQPRKKANENLRYIFRIRAHLWRYSPDTGRTDRASLAIGNGNTSILQIGVVDQARTPLYTVCARVARRARLGARKSLSAWQSVQGAKGTHLPYAGVRTERPHLASLRRPASRRGGA